MSAWMKFGYYSLQACLSNGALKLEQLGVERCRCGVWEMCAAGAPLPPAVVVQC